EHTHRLHFSGSGFNGQTSTRVDIGIVLRQGTDAQVTCQVTFVQPHLRDTRAGSDNRADIPHPESRFQENDKVKPPHSETTLTFQHREQLRSHDDLIDGFNPGQHNPMQTRPHRRLNISMDKGFVDTHKYLRCPLPYLANSLLDQSPRLSLARVEHTV